MVSLEKCATAPKTKTTATHVVTQHEDHGLMRCPLPTDLDNLVSLCTLEALASEYDSCLLPQATENDIHNDTIPEMISQLLMEMWHGQQKHGGDLLNLLKRNNLQRHQLF